MKTVSDEGSTYGYELQKKLKEKSNCYWDPTYSTVYEALKRMEKEGRMERTGEGEKGKKYYQLTNEGKEALKEKEKNLKNTTEEYEEMALGFLNLYRDLVGEDELQDLVKKIEKEFEISLRS